MVMETKQDSEDNSAQNQAETFPNKLDVYSSNAEVPASIHDSLKTSNVNMSYTSSAASDAAAIASYQTTDSTSSNTNSYTVGSQYQPSTMSTSYHDSHRHMYPADGMKPGMQTPPRFPGPPTSSAPNINQQPAATPTLNQLLTQSPQGGQKYPPYSDYSSSTSSSGAVPPNQPMYDVWSNQPRNPGPHMYPGPGQMNHPMRGGPGGSMPSNVRAMPPNNMQV